MKKNKKYAISWESNVQDTFSCFPNVWIQLAYAFSSRNQDRRGGYYPPLPLVPLFLVGYVQVIWYNNIVHLTGYSLYSNSIC
ncbi:MAG: hypothetical protein Q4G00_01545, partial [Clostridia bacterium]|nr:hypothetical protein [Clostridia bacterium]